MLVEDVIVVPTRSKGLFAPNLSYPLACITGVYPTPTLSKVIAEPFGLLLCILNSISEVKGSSLNREYKIDISYLLAILESSFLYL
jgi:hypothetical protein